MFIIHLRWSAPPGGHGEHFEGPYPTEGATEDVLSGLGFVKYSSPFPGIHWRGIDRERRRLCWATVFPLLPPAS